MSQDHTLQRGGERERDRERHRERDREREREREEGGVRKMVELKGVVNLTILF